MIEIPVVVHVLVVPDDFAAVGRERERRVVVEVRPVDAPEHELRGRRGDGRPDVDEVEVRVVAGHHPRADVGPPLERHVAPRLVARLARRRNQAPPPELRAGRRVVRSDDAGLRSPLRHAAPTGDDLPVRDDRARGLVGGVHPVVEDPRLPHQAAGRGVEREDVVVGARVDDRVAVDGDVAVGGRDGDVLLEVVGAVPAVLPDQVAGDGVDGLDDVARVGHVQDAVIDQRRPLLGSLRHPPGPDHAQRADVGAIDLVQRAVAPAVERAPPHRPVRRVRILQHRIRDRREAVVLGGGRTGPEEEQERDERMSATSEGHGELLGRRRRRALTGALGVCAGTNRSMARFLRRRLPARLRRRVRTGKGSDGDGGQAGGAARRAGGRQRNGGPGSAGRQHRAQCSRGVPAVKPVAPRGAGSTRPGGR